MGNLAMIETPSRISGGDAAASSAVTLHAARSSSLLRFRRSDCTGFFGDDPAKKSFAKNLS